MIVMGLEYEVYTLRLIANGLYDVDLVYEVTFLSNG